MASQGTFVENPENFGGLFQWGRRGDGHEQRDSPTTPERSTTDVPGHGNFIIAFPDWRNPQNDNLWGNPKTANDPCPAGWRVPTEEEFSSLINSGSTWIAVNGVAGRRFGTAPNTLFLPAAGRRDNTGTVSLVGTGGYYWSSTPVPGTTSARWFYFGSSNASMSNSNRVGGFSVRCVAE